MTYQRAYYDVFTQTWRTTIYISTSSSMMGQVQRQKNTQWLVSNTSLYPVYLFTYNSVASRWSPHHVLLMAFLHTLYESMQLISVSCMCITLSIFFFYRTKCAVSYKHKRFKPHWKGHCGHFHCSKYKVALCLL